MKHPVPKYKTPKRKTHSRHYTFVRRAVTRLTDIVNLIDCPNCGEKCMAHHACKNCGKYRGRQVINMQKQVDKITKVKA